MDGGAWWAAVHGVAGSRTQLSDLTFTFHFHALEKEMATHSSVLAWRTPGMGEPGGLPSMGSHRVGHDWSNLAAAAALYLNFYLLRILNNWYHIKWYQLSLSTKVEAIHTLRSYKPWIFICTVLYPTYIQSNISPLLVICVAYSPSIDFFNFLNVIFDEQKFLF